MTQFNDISSQLLSTLAEHKQLGIGDMIDYDDVPQDVSQNVLQKQDAEILRMIRDNPNITRKQMADKLGVSTKTVGRKLSKLPMVEYVGPAKCGHWETKGA